MVEALIGAMNHSAELVGGDPAVTDFTERLRAVMHTLMVSGRGTRDLCGPAGQGNTVILHHPLVSPYSRHTVH